MKNIFCISVLFGFCIVMTGCLETSSLSGQQSAQSQFNGCTSAFGLSNNSVQINFEYPSNATKVIVLRNGVEIGSSSSSSTTSVIDFNLTEGVTYTYTCTAYNGPRPIVGLSQAFAAPINTNAPTFSGISSVNALSFSSGNATWAPEAATGAKASSYKVYANPGAHVDWNASPRVILKADGNISYKLENLGDELTYAVGVRACTEGGICDNNTHFLPLTLPDGGAPKTLGVSKVSAYNLMAFLDAPWMDSQGAILKRQIFMCKVSSGTTCSFSNIPTKTYAVTDLAAPPTQLVLENIEEYAEYRFKVVDIDPSGNSNASTTIASLTTGDLTAPSFGGITNLTRGTPANSTAEFSFIALPREGTSDSGATTGVTSYLLYMNSADYPGTPANACNNATYFKKISAAGFSPGIATYNLTGLKERTTYSFCLRAQDAAGNTSANTTDSRVLTSDLTAPSFEGIQSITFNTGSRKIIINWNATSSSDLRNYILKIWKNTPTPAVSDITSFTLAPSITTREFTSADIAMNDYDKVYAVVEACDNAANLGLAGLNDNCTLTSATNTKSITLPDINPPLGFTGIKPSLTSPAEGKALVEWYVPTAWTSDYYGFRIYQVDTSNNSISLITSCLCATPGSCNNTDKQCLVSGLTPAKSYRLHVRAFDALGNETNYITPDISFADLKISDTTAPSFNSGLTINLLTLSWSAATDNQFNGEGNTITYRVYRKANATFTNPLDPSADGSTIATLSTRTFTDNTLSLVGTYYYTVCAIDSAGNRACDGNIKSITVNDITPPTIGSFTSTKSIDDTLLKRWSLSWTISDDVTASSALRTRIYQKSSATDAGVLATTADTKILDQVGTVTLGPLTGDANTSQFINYLLWIQDAAGNVSTRNITVHSVNNIAITSVNSTVGSIAGGRTIVIKGSGFSKSSTNGYSSSTVVKVGAQDCNNIQILSDRYISCTTPSSVAGVVAVSVTNPEGSSAILTNAYTYIGISSSDICGNPSSWGSTFAAGVGSAGNPFIICTPTHFNNIFQTTPINYVSANYYYALGDNIDLASNPTSINSCSTATNLFFIGTLDGRGHGLLNNNVSTTGANACMFQLGHGGNTVTLKNISFLNHTYTTTYATASQSVYMALFGLAGNATINLDKVSVLATFNQPSTAAMTVRMGGLFHSANIIAIGVNVTNSDVDVTFSTASTSGASTGGITATHGYGTLSVAGSRVAVTQNVPATSRYYTGGITYSLANSLLSVSKSEVYVKVSSSSANSTAGSRLAGVIPYLGGSLIVDQTKVSFETKNILAGYQGGIAGRGSASGFANISITDSYVVGSMDGVDIRGALIAGAEAASSSSTVTLARNISHLNWNYFSGARSAGAFLYALDGSSAYNGTLNASGIIYDSLKSDSGSLSGSATSVSATGYSTTALHDQTPTTNPYASAGFDFTAGTGKWKWCYSNDRPYLMWETCQ
ncbi:hypothetical protein AZI86_10730 [Bdellovibrio bacteriovorus]|uniref:Fibronectin type-III domain-containing protein n=1 Tax=Bdellovibrio bacteriovorus TaxID=959 RepID=A0A150WL73_BDEBC|nr:IPT/TIG domain-containing protein [Bdellovibrio bacteriovorus]KYG64678.1 hypothetical protein AZI86_10730 [Bdellovibrio bacteriovorus]